MLMSNPALVGNGNVLLLTGGKLVLLDIIASGRDVQPSAVGDG